MTTTLGSWAPRQLVRKTLFRHMLVALLAIGLVLGFAAVRAQWSPMHRWNRAFGDASGRSGRLQRRALICRRQPVDSRLRRNGSAGQRVSAARAAE